MFGAKVEKLKHIEGFHFSCFLKKLRGKPEMCVFLREEGLCSRVASN